MSAGLALRAHSHVYVVGDPDGPQKIGIATNPKNRLAALRTANTGNLVIVVAAVVPFELAREAERFAHWILRDHHARGEWFSVSPEAARNAVETAISAVVAGHRAPNIGIGGPGRRHLKLTERTVKTTVRLPEGLLARITALVGDQQISKFFRQAAEAKLAAEEPAPPPAD